MPYRDEWERDLGEAAPTTRATDSLHGARAIRRPRIARALRRQRVSEIEFSGFELVRQRLGCHD